MNSPWSLDGRIAVVTGAGSGIGQETAHELARQGATLFVTDINADTAAATAAAIGAQATAVRHDVTRADDWAALFAQVQAAHGALDTLVNNAGIMLSTPFADAPVAMLHRQQAINVDSLYLGMQGAQPLMLAAVERHGGTASIINISSVYGMVAGAQFAAYSATKGAVRGLSRAVAYEWARQGIRVNTVLPGPVATNLGADWDPPVDANGQPLSPEAALAAWASLIPMGRLGEARDIAPLVAFLASDAARFITGAEFVADGGYTAG
jgi:NAD(P)-dependent dehydrogenase (short-subunit alcohol dehydrogenase family)